MRLFWIVALLVAADSAQAGTCDHRCADQDGDLCIWLLKPSRELSTQVFERGLPVQLRIGRQSGTCGGYAELPPSEVVATYASDPTGPFVPLPILEKGDELVWTPTIAGVNFVTVAARDGRGQKAKTMAVIVGPPEEPERLYQVTLRIVGPPNAHLRTQLRYVPPHEAAARQSGFGPSRWPVLYDGSVATRGTTLRLPRGRYQARIGVDRLSAEGSTLTQFSVERDGAVMARVPKGRLDLKVPKSATLTRVEVTYPDGVVDRLCVGGDLSVRSLRFYMNPGSAEVAWYTPATSFGGERCADGERLTATAYRRANVQIHEQKGIELPWSADGHQIKTHFPRPSTAASDALGIDLD